MKGESHVVTGKMMEKRQITLPPVFRYLPQKYIDEFFTSGKLRLSAFSEFAKHTDEQRLDPQEGWGRVDIKGKKVHLVARAGMGHDAYVLSTSLRGDTELMNVFGADGYFKISDPLRFFQAVADKTPDCPGGRVGMCIYVGDREIHRSMGEAVDDAIKTNDQGKRNLMKAVGLINAAMQPEAYFLKLAHHAHQQEVRFIWQVGHEVHEPLFIECPEAVQFCERIT